MQLSRIHDVFPRTAVDRTIFLLAFIVGVVGGVLLKLAGVHPVVSASFAALILAIYAISAWMGGRLKIEPETIGDNCYYLGFLFTLASLSFTLYQMADPSKNGGSPVDIPEVISGFGVALSSTIFGVLLRVLMMQMRIDFVAKDREVRADVNRAYSDFRKNLSGVISQVKAFSTESVQLAAEREARMRAATDRLAEDNQKALEEQRKAFFETANAVSAQMTETFSRSVQVALNEISKSMTETQVTFQKQLAEALVDLQAIKTRLKEQETNSATDIESQRRRVNDNLSEAVKEINNHNDALKTSARSIRSSSDAIEKKLIPAIDALETKLNSLAATDTSQLTLFSSLLSSDGSRPVQSEPAPPKARWWKRMRM
jgi:hypothetical protein